MSNLNPIRACDSSPSVAFSIQDVCSPHIYNVRAPIDDYYAAAQGLTLLGTQSSLGQSPVLGRLLLLGHVSATESYVRALLVRLLGICEICREHSSVLSIPLSSVYYYKPEEIALGVFDGTSLAGADEIGKMVRKFTKFDINGSELLRPLLKRFDEICHLRHAAVHAHGTISTGSASALNIETANQRYQVELDFGNVQKIALICRSLVQELNQYLFQETLARWSKAGLLRRTYEEDRPTFVAAWTLFRSLEDNDSKLTRPKMAYDRLVGALGNSR